MVYSSFDWLLADNRRITDRTTDELRTGIFFFCARMLGPVGDNNIIIMEGRSVEYIITVAKIHHYIII
jgi:hypothetical protein